MVSGDNATEPRVGFLQHLLSNETVTVLNGVVGLKICVCDVTPRP